MGRKQISTDKIKLSPYRDRLHNELPEVVDHHSLSEIPLLVVQSRESGNYFVTKHTSLFLKLRNRGEKSILCDVRSTVDLDQEAYAIRGAYVMDDHIPFHILERAMFVTECAEEVKSKYGPGGTYVNGGNRRGKDFKKKSILEEISKLVPYKSKEIDTLKRFGGHTSTYGIEGLFSLLKQKEENISYHCINDNNSRLKKQNLRAKIDARVAEMKGKAMSEEQIEDEIGLMVYRVLFGEDPEDEENPPDTEAQEEEEGAGAEQGNTDDENAGEDDPGAQPVVSPYKRVDQDGLDRMITAYKVHISDQVKGLRFLRNKKLAGKGLSENDSEKFFKEHFNRARFSETGLAQEVVIQIGGQVPVNKP